LIVRGGNLVGHLMLGWVGEVGGAERARFGHQNDGLGWNGAKKRGLFVNLRQLSQKLGM
jgi:hypothetical protein